MSPYQQGYSDHLDGKELKDNPYDDITQLVLFEGWQEGWYDAFDDLLGY